MSWVALGTSAVGAAGSLLGGGGGGAPAGPNVSGVGDSTFNFGSKPANPAWVVPFVIGLLSVVSLGLVFLILRRSGKKTK